MEEHLYLCPNCYNALAAPDVSQPCNVCGHTLLECKPGAPDDPCRKPLMDTDGDVQSHAPQWWVDSYKRLSNEEPEGLITDDAA